MEADRLLQGSKSFVAPIINVLCVPEVRDIGPPPRHGAPSLFFATKLFPRWGEGFKFDDIELYPLPSLTWVADNLNLEFYTDILICMRATRGTLATFRRQGRVEFKYLQLLNIIRPPLFYNLLIASPFTSQHF